MMKLTLAYTNYALLAISALLIQGAHLVKGQGWRLLPESVAIKPSNVWPTLVLKSVSGNGSRSKPRT